MPDDPGTLPAPDPAEDSRWFERVSQALAPPPPARLADLEILAEVAAGGQGRVYRARQKGTHRIVALKRLRAGALATPAAAARFRREVELASALRHPGIVTIHEVVDDDAAPALIMEWVDGLPFDAWADSARAEPQGLRRVVAAAALAADALAAAHGRAVLHRDLKPANILVDQRDQPRILDFGLARSLVGDSLTLTHEGGFLGTPAYCPPEQLDGHLADLDVRADVYALGAVIYRAVTGRPAYTDTDSVTRLVEAVRGGLAPRPSTLDPRVDHDLDEVIRKAMSPDRDLRYPTAAALADDLRRWLDHAPVLARPPSLSYYARKFVRRHRAAVALAGVAVVLILAGAAVAAVLAIRLSRSEVELRRTVASLRESVADEAEALEDARDAQSRAERAVLRQRAALTSVFQAMADMHHAERSGPAMTVAQAVDRRTAALDNPRARLAPDTEASVRLALGVLNAQLGRPDHARDLFQRAADLLEGANVVSYDLTEAHSQLGLLALAAGDSAAAIEHFSRALAVVQADPIQARDECMTRMNLARATLAAGRLDEAQEHAERAAEGLHSMLEPARQKILADIAAARAKPGT
jgi:eukaryotic-like serine/threonine-protein kinase